MPRIISVGTGIPEFSVSQSETMEFARQLFSGSFKDLERLLNVFHNGQIEKRNFVKKIDWYKENHTFAEKNAAFIEEAVKLCIESIKDCLTSEIHNQSIPYEEVDAIFLVTTTGLATPSLEARIMNELPFSRHTKRIPIWGLGCAGGASGLARAYEYCKAFPRSKALVVSVELCSLTFQKDDASKSNLIGTSLFADGAAAVLVGGDEVEFQQYTNRTLPAVVDTRSTLMDDSLDVMGWDVKDNGLHVVFSKSIPNIVKNWLEPNVTQFLEDNHLKSEDIEHFIAHPGGKKVLSAYEQALGFTKEKTAISLNVLSQYGNMSSATVLYVLQQFMEKDINKGEYGLITALGPGFSSELLLVRWE